MALLSKGSCERHTHSYGGKCSITVSLHCSVRLLATRTVQSEKNLSNIPFVLIFYACALPDCFSSIISTGFSYEER